MSNVNTLNAPQIPGMENIPAAPQPQAQPSNVGNTGAVQSAPQQPQHQGNQITIVGKVNLPVTSLLEITGFVDTSKKFPTSNAFVMFVPGKPDQSKATGITYDQDNKEVMKISNKDLFALAEAIKFAAMYQQCDFIVFTDSSKFAGNQGQGVNKKLSVTTAPSRRDPNKYMIFINYAGAKKINITLDKWGAIGFAEQIKALATQTEMKKHEIESSYKK